jgi:hypothetical protein
MLSLMLKKLLHFIWPVIRYYRLIRKPYLLKLYEYRIFKTYSNVYKDRPLNKSITIMIDDNFSQSGLLDKLKGIISGAWLAEQLKIQLNIYISDSNSAILSIFRLDKQHLLIRNQSYLFNRNTSKPIVIYNFTPNNYISVISKFKAIKNYNFYCNENLLKLLYSDKMTIQFQWSKLFFSLFNFQYVNLEREHLIFSKTENIGVHFRFMNLLGDFDDVRITELSEFKKNELINLCLSKLKFIISKHNLSVTYFIKSDSITFLNIVKSLFFNNKNVIININNIGHTGLDNNHNILKQAYTDFFDLSRCSTIYQVALDNMRVSEFSKYASYINNSNLETIIH